MPSSLTGFWLTVALVYLGWQVGSGLRAVAAAIATPTRPEEGAER